MTVSYACMIETARMAKRMDRDIGILNSRLLLATKTKHQIIMRNLLRNNHPASRPVKRPPR